MLTWWTGLADAPPDEAQALHALGLGFMAARTLHVALELRLFTHLAAGVQTLAQVAQALGLAERAAGRLLYACTALGLVQATGAPDAYSVVGWIDHDATSGKGGRRWDAHGVRMLYWLERAQGAGHQWPSPGCSGSGAMGASQMRQHHRNTTARLQGLRAQVRDYFTLQGQRRKLFPRALLVGLLAGSIAVAFRWALEGGDLLRNRLILWAYQAPTWGWLLPMVMGALGAGLAVGLVHRVAPEAAGSGIPHVKAVLYWFRSMRWQAILLVKFVGGVVGIGSGLALGREGPTVQLGSALGAAVAHGLRVSPRERQALIAAGAGAGLAAAFNAPLAGLTFVLEELQRHFAPAVFGAAFVAAVTADVLTRLFTSQLPVFHVTSAPTPPLVTLPVFLVLGLLAGVLGVAFNRGLLRTLELFTRVRGWPASLHGVCVGAVVGLLGWFVPAALGGGQPLVDAVLKGYMPLAHIPWWFLLRFGLTMVSYGCGAPGGIFAPLLVLEH